MTDLLYQSDSYLRVFEAVVVEVGESGVVLDRTAFYPGGGGQPCDTGRLEAGGGALPVRAVRKAGGQSAHP